MHRVLPCLLGLVLAAPAAAEIPQPVRAMIDAAIATGDRGKVDAVIEAAKATNPGDEGEIDALRSGFLAAQNEQAKLRAERQRAARQGAGLLKLWSGKGELSGFRATGNSDSAGLTGALTLTRKGADWTHKLAVRADFQRSHGQAARDQLVASYEPRYQIRDDLFAYGLAQYERDRFQGFAARYSLSGGLGYHVFDGPRLDMSIKAGPAFRYTAYTDGERDRRLAGLVGLDFDWKMTDALKLTQTANAVTETGGAAVAIIDSRNTTLNLVTGLEAKVTDRLSTRVSYAVDYDSNPATGRATTDTMTRFGLVYGF